LGWFCRGTSAPSGLDGIERARLISRRQDGDIHIAVVAIVTGSLRSKEIDRANIGNRLDQEIDQSYWQELGIGF